MIPSSGARSDNGRETPDPDGVVRAFRGIQNEIWDAVETRDPGHGTEDRWDRPGGGGGLSRAIENGAVFEKGGVNFSHVRGDALPPSATERRPHLADQPFEATGVSVVLHPVNPYAPSAHLNVRAFFVRTESEIVWWFGGGFDLTPCYGFDEDAIEWHRAAKETCDPLHPTLYRKFKKECDRYFFLPHRNECRGVGGIFFDDFNERSFAPTLDFVLSVARAFRKTYFSIVDRRKDTPYGTREEKYLRIRRGRYVEFNLLYDRGTRFGLASGGRTESVLMSLPRHADWSYGHLPEPGSPEETLVERYLQPRDWLADGTPAEDPIS